MGLVRRTISPHAAPLRRDATDAERTLWHALRARGLGGHKFRRQWTIGPYIADFCCVERHLIVEVDGSQHNPVSDRARTAFLRREGFRLIRFWNNDVLNNLDGVLLTILEALGRPQKEEEDPHPNLLPQAGEGAPPSPPAPNSPSPARGRG